MATKIKSEEISSIIKERIENFNINIDISETGKVIAYADGVAKVYGLNNVMYYEMVEFDTGDTGIAFNLEESSVGVVVLGSGRTIKEGTSVKRLKKLMKVPVGDAVVGRVINTLGEPIDGKGAIEASEYRFVEEKAPGIMARKSVHQPLQTGIKSVEGKENSLSAIGKQVKQPLLWIRLSIKKVKMLYVFMSLWGKKNLRLHKL